MKINQKIIVILFTSAMVMGLTVYALLSKTQDVLEDQIGAEALLLTEQIITEIDEEIYRRIEEMQVFARDISLINDASISNEQFDRTPDVQGVIEATDNDWKSGRTTPFISDILNNELSQKLNKHLDIYKQIYGYDLFGEMYVTNKYGVAIATTRRISDYLQADESWYTSAKAEKEFWVDDLEYDDSSGIFSISILVKLYDDQGSFAGFLKGTLNLEDIKYTMELIQSQSPYKSMKTYLVDRNGLSIFSGLDPKLKQQGRDIRLTEFGTDISSRLPVTEAMKGNKGYLLRTEDGKELLSVFSYSKGFRNFKSLGWSIIIDFEADEIFGPIAKFKSNLAIIIVITMTVFTLIAVFTFYSISKPIITLKEASIEISKGKLDTRVDFKSKDETGQLGDTFNEMSRRLSERDSQLRKSEEKHRTLLENLPQKIFYKDKNSVYISCNDNFASDLAISPDQIVGKTDFDLFPKALAEKYISDDQLVMRSGQPDEIEETYVSNGQEYTIQTVKTPVTDEDGNTIGILGIFWDITDRKLVEDELKKYRDHLEDSEKKFRAVIEHAVMAIISSDSEGKIIFWNKAAEKMFGYAREEIIVKELQTIMPERYRRAHLKGLKRFAKTGKTRIVNRPMELAGLRKDGTEFPIELTISMWKMGQELFFTAMISDITERKLIEEKILNLAKFPSENPSPVLRVRKDGKLLYANDACRSLLEDWQCRIGETIPEHLHKSILEVFESGQNKKIEFDCDRQVFSLVLAAVKQTDYVNLYGRDVTERAKNERMIAQQLDELQRSRLALLSVLEDEKLAEQQLEKLLKTLAAKNEELESILYAVSHDLRSPLVNIQGFGHDLSQSCELIRSALKSKEKTPEMEKILGVALNEDIPNALDFILTSTTKMDSLLSGLLDICRLNTVTTNIKTIDMNEMMVNVAANMEYQIKETGAKVDVDSLPACVGDPSQINRVFSNLLTNALKFLDQTRPGKIRICGKSQDNKSIYCVEDNGIGIDPGHQKKIFQIFYQLEPDKRKGEGIGLTIVRRIIEKHNGKVWVNSEPGKGSKFFVSLPST